MKIIKMKSPNHYNGRFGWKADTTCCHQTGTDDLDKALRWYMNPASDCCPTAVIAKDGTIYQLIELDDAPYSNGTRVKAGQSLYYGLATSKLVKGRKTNANYFTYSIEFVHCARGDITDAQVQAAVEFIRDLLIPHMKKNGVTPKIDRDHIIGHCEIDPVTRAACPGRNFPYQKIIDGVLGKATASTSSTSSTTAVSEFGVGDSVKIKRTANFYAGSEIKIPDRVKGKGYVIDSVKGDKARLQPINSWVYFIDLEK